MKLTLCVYVLTLHAGLTWTADPEGEILPTFGGSCGGTSLDGQNCPTAFQILPAILIEIFLYIIESIYIFIYLTIYDILHLL